MTDYSDDDYLNAIEEQDAIFLEIKDKLDRDDSARAQDNPRGRLQIMWRRSKYIKFLESKCFFHLSETWPVRPLEFNKLHNVIKK